MNKKTFTDKDIEILSYNKYVKNVSEKGITYTDEFKRIFIAENENGKLPREIFEENGFNVEILGNDRINSSRKRWRAAYGENGVCGLQDNKDSVEDRVHHLLSERLKNISDVFG